MKTFMELIKSRHSVRKYKEQEVEKEKIDMLLEAGRVAPTAANRQPCTYFVLRGEDECSILEDACNYFKAPLVMVICSDKAKAWKRKYDGATTADIDASIIATHIMLEAIELGLGSCWIAYFDPEIVKKELRLPEGLEPINILALGYPDDKEKPVDRFDVDRKPIDEIVRYGKL